MDPDLQDKIDTWTPDPGRRPEDVDWFPPVFEDAPFGIAAVDMLGNFVRVNRAFCELHGRTSIECQTMSIADFTQSDDLAMHEATMSLARDGEIERYANEHPIVRPDGTMRWAEVNATTIHDDSGKAVYALIQYHDTTSVHDAEEVVRETTEALDLTVENAPIAIYGVDLEGKVLSWNPRAAELFGYTAEEVIGKEIPIVPDAGIADAEAGLDQLSQGEAIHNQEARLRHRDGHELDVLTSAMVTHDADGKPKSIVAFTMDVTEQRRMESELRRNEQQMRTIFRKISDTVTVVDARGRVKYSTVEFRNVLGYEGSFWKEHTIFDIVHPDDLERTERFFADLFAVAGTEFNDVLRVRGADGDYIPIEGSGINLLDDPEVRGIILTARDLTDFKRTQDLLADEARVLGLIARNAPLDRTLTAVIEMVERHSQGGRSAIIFVNEDGTYQVGPAPNVPDEVTHAIDRTVPIWPIVTAVAERRTVVVADVDSDVEATTVLEAAHRYGVRSGWTRPIIESGEERVLGVICTYYSDAVDPTTHELRVADLASDLAAIAIDGARSRDALTERAHFDGMTGLPNRTYLVELIGERLTQAADDGSGMAVLFVDLDRFKNINDSLGHAAGDDLLRQVGARLQGAVRPDDVVGRFSADDFVILLMGIIDHGEITPVVNRIDQAVAEPFTTRTADGDVYLSASIGVAWSEDGDGSAENLIELAGAAMYQAKEHGRDRLEIYDQHMRTRARERLQLEHDLRLAVEREELVVYYQPKIDLADGRIIGTEALVRWAHPERGLVLPNDFIPIAEETGLIIGIGRFVLEEAVSQARAWVNAVPGLHKFLMSVNFSTRQISAPDLVTNVARVLLKNSWPPERLAIELTESVLIEDAEAALELLRDLKGLGIKLAIDDFGTGYSSLSYLHQFPVDIVKIDQAFVSQMEADGSGSAVTTAVMHMADALDLVTCAEGVEATKQLEGLRQIGCRWAQGFLFSRPLPADEMTELLQAGSRW